jgi:hypothetical protein
MNLLVLPPSGRKGGPCSTDHNSVNAGPRHYAFSLPPDHGDAFSVVKVEALVAESAVETSW